MGKKLAKEGIIWLDDSSTYVADKSLYTSPEAFLQAVIDHIADLLKDPKRREWEAGWYEVPEFGKYINQVSTSWMVHRVGRRNHWLTQPGTPSERGRGNWWENLDEPERGCTPVWIIDFSEDIEGKVLRRLTGRYHKWNPEI